MREIELDGLRRAFAALEGRARGGCPAPERLWSGARGELPSGAVRPLVLHLAECGACAEAWRLAREVEPRLAPAPAAVPASSRAPVAWRRWGSLAAAVAVALAGAVLLRAPREPAPGFRDGGRSAIRSLTSETVPLPRARCLLRWTAGPPGATYGLKVASEDLEAVAEARGLTVTSYEVPPRALQSLPPGAKLLWQVETVAADGARMTSPTFVSRVQ